MYPGILLIIDPRAQQARKINTELLSKLQQDGSPAPVTASKEGWSATVFAPAARESYCGADIFSSDGDILMWAGEMFLPDSWTGDSRSSGNSIRNISYALLQQLRKNAIEPLADIDGGFCGAWYNAQEDCWSIFNDRQGLLPIFYHVDHDRLVIAPKAWLAWLASGKPLAVNDNGVLDLLRTTNMTGENTLIKDVHWLLGGHTLRWSQGSLSKRRYWDFSFSPDPRLHEEDQIDRFADRLSQSMQRNKQTESPLRLGITGGLDSRLILSFSQRTGRLPACFTVGWPFSEDVRFGRAQARAVGAPHDWVPLEAAGLPEALADAIVRVDGLHSATHLAPATAMLPYLRQKSGSVLLEGYLLGLLGGPFVPEDDDIQNAQPPHQSRWARSRLHGGRSFDTVDKLLHPFHASESRHRWQTMVDETYAAAPVKNPLKKAEYVILSGRSGRNNVAGTRLLQEHALVRCPGCDKQMLDWYSTVSLRTWRGKKPFITLLRWRFPSTAAVPRSGSSGLPLTDDWLWREYCWQREKMYRWCVQRRHPWTREWGISGTAMRAWTFHHWQKSGALDMLTRKDARILEWVDRDALMDVWHLGRQNPLKGTQLLDLATVETMIRWLEEIKPLPSAQASQSIQRTTPELGLSATP